MAEELERLLLRVDVDLERLRRGLGRAEKVTDTFGKKMTQIARRIKDKFSSAFSAIGNAARKFVIVGAAIAATLTIITARSLSATDKIGKLSKRLGIATEDLGTFQVLAKRSGIEFNQFAIAVQRLTRRIGQAAIGEGEATAALKELNLEARELRKLPLAEQFEKIADALGSVENATDRVRLAQKLFDSEGVQLLQTMQNGGEAFRLAAKDARLFGISLSADAVAGVEAVTDSITDLKLISKGATDQLVAAFAPAIRVIVDLIKNKMVEAITANGGTVESWAKGVAISVLNLFRQINSAVAVFFLKTVRLVDDINRKLPEAFQLAQISFDNVVKINEGFMAINETIDGLIVTVREAGTELEDALDGVPEKLEEAADAADDLGDSLDEVKTRGIDVSGTLENTFANFFRTGKFGAKEMVNSILSEFARLAASQLVKGIFTKILKFSLLAAKDGGPVKGFASGGFVSGPGGPREDRVPALLSNGEFVINAKSTRKFGSLLTAINNGAAQTFASGGPVRGAPGSMAGASPAKATQPTIIINQENSIVTAVPPQIRAEIQNLVAATVGQALSANFAAIGGRT